MLYLYPYYLRDKNMIFMCSFMNKLFLMRNLKKIKIWYFQTKHSVLKKNNVCLLHTNSFLLILATISTTTPISVESIFSTVKLVKTMAKLSSVLLRLILANPDSYFGHYGQKEGSGGYCF